MSGMLIPSNEQPSLYDDPVPDSLITVARARTLTVLPRLGGDRKARVVQFLYESGLITKDKVIVDLLKGADLHGANLGEAQLSYANLSRANLSEADLSGADLSGADLSGATGWTEEQLDLAKSLKGATMPDGQKYEDWLESKANAEEGKNSDP